MKCQICETDTMINYGNAYQIKCSVCSDPNQPNPIVSKAFDANLDFLLFHNDETKGPFSYGQLKQMWKSGQITTKYLFWQEGFEDWKPISLARLDASHDEADTFKQTQELIKEQKKTTTAVRFGFFAILLIFVAIPMFITQCSPQ